MAWDKIAPTMPSDVTSLSDEQIIAWYSRHPHPTVRSLVHRLTIKLQEDVPTAYMQGFEEGVRQAKMQKPNPHGFSPSELRIAEEDL